MKEKWHAKGRSSGEGRIRCKVDGRERDKAENRRIGREKGKASG